MGRVCPLGVIDTKIDSLMMSRMRFRWFLWVLIVFWAFSRPGIAGETYSQMSFQLPSGKVLKAEAAMTRETQTKGLMFRKHLAEDRGMLLIYPQDGIHGIWMKNCLVSLDLLWLDKDYRIIYMKERVPPCLDEPCPTYKPPLKSRYVLEVHEGIAEKERLGPGSQLLFMTSGLKP